jgi:hypothetical protein
MRYNPKTETLYNRGDDFKVIKGDYRRPEFKQLADSQIWVVTEKVDGMSVVWELVRNGQFSYGGRTRKTQFTPEQTAFMENTGAKFSYNARKIFDSHPTLEALSVYAELYGPGIQNGGALSEELEVSAFDITANDIYMPWQRFVETCDMLEVGSVPLIFDWPVTMELARFLTTNGFESSLADIKPEGVVARTPVYMYDAQGRRIMWKLKLSDW